MGESIIASNKPHHWRWLPAAALLVPTLLAGCYAPLHSPGIAAHTLPDEFRFPTRTAAEPINFSALSADQPAAYCLGLGDVLEISIPDLNTPGSLQVMQATVLEQGWISLPRVGPIAVGGLSLSDAQDQVNRTLAAGVLQNPRATVRLVQKGTVNVLVLGAVKKPGVHALPRYENDVAHALAAAEGFTEEAGEVIEVHRRHAAPLPPAQTPDVVLPVAPHVITNIGYQPQQPMPAPTQFAPPSNQQLLSPPPPQPRIQMLPAAPLVAPARITTLPPPPPQSRPAAPPQSSPDRPYQDYRQQSSAPRPVIRGQSPHDVPPSPAWFPPVHPTATEPVFPVDGAGPILRIPLRGDASWISPADVTLQAGDVVIVPQKTHEVFYVVGPLSEQSRVRFTVGDRDREIGNGLLLPRDREIDVVTAVAMAGYIDPILSPTKVTLQRVGPDGMPLLIIVDLIAARADPQETLLVQPGDIIYLNPDNAWYTRRLLDKVISQALGTAVGRWLTN